MNMNLNKELIINTINVHYIINRITKGKIALSESYKIDLRVIHKELFQYISLT